MIRNILTVLLVAVVVWFGLKFSRYAKQKIGETPVQMDGEAPAAGKLPGMIASLEPTYETAKRDGAEGVARFLKQHSSEIRDPRLADLQLDYVLLVGSSNQAEAKRVLALIEARITPRSPVFKRFEQLRKSYP